MATETSFSGMPMLSFMAHLTLIDSDGFTTAVTVFGKHGIKTVQTIRTTVAHNVSLSTQLSFAL